MMTERNPDDVTLHDLTAVFRSLATRESAEEMVRLLRERNRQLKIHVRDQHPETQAVRQALAEGKRRLAEAVRQLIEAQRSLTDDLRRRDNDEPAA